MMRWGQGIDRRRSERQMTLLGVEVDKRDIAFALLTAPLVLAGLWLGVALLFASAS